MARYAIDFVVFVRFGFIPCLQVGKETQAGAIFQPIKPRSVKPLIFLAFVRLTISPPHLLAEMVGTADLWADELPPLSSLGVTQPIVPVGLGPIGGELFPYSAREHPAQPGEEVAPEKRLGVLQ